VEEKERKWVLTVQTVVASKRGCDGAYTGVRRLCWRAWQKCDFIRLEDALTFNLLKKEMLSLQNAVLLSNKNKHNKLISVNFDRSHYGPARTSTGHICQHAL
jgi:hypothetical protein